MSWVTVRMVRPVRARTASSSRRKARIRCASWPVVGSSSTSTPGAPTRSAASASRCLPPWLSSQGLVCSSPRKPKNSIAPSTSRTGFGGIARNRLPNSSSLMTVSSNSISSAACSSSATCAACSNTLPGRTGFPRKYTRPELGVPRPTVRPVSVLLPEPFAPIIATHSPSAMDSVTSSIARLAAKSTVT